MSEFDSSEKKQDEIVYDLLQENKRLLTENNTLLRKMYRFGVISFWVRVTWYILLIGLPFALYFYILEPYFTALGSSYDTFSAGIQEIPGWKHLNQFLGVVFGSGE